MGNKSPLQSIVLSKGQQLGASPRLFVQTAVPQKINKKCEPIQAKLGRRTVEPNFAHHLKEITNRLDAYLRVEDLVFETSSGPKSRPIVFADSKTLIEKVLYRYFRNITDSWKKRTGN